MFYFLRVIGKQIYLQKKIGNLKLVWKLKDYLKRIKKILQTNNEISLKLIFSN